MDETNQFVQVCSTLPNAQSPPFLLPPPHSTPERVPTTPATKCVHGEDAFTHFHGQICPLTIQFRFSLPITLKRGPTKANFFKTWIKIVDTCGTITEQTGGGRQKSTNFQWISTYRRIPEHSKGFLVGPSSSTTVAIVDPDTFVKSPALNLSWTVKFTLSFFGEGVE